MKTKLQIIQSLLDERKITAEEAIVLMQSEKEYVYVPYQQWNNPWYINPWPSTPLAPTWHNGTASNDVVITTTRN